MENGAQQGRAEGRRRRGKLSRGGRVRTFVLAAGLAASAAVVAGCANDRNRANANDPLLGGRNPPPGSIAMGPGSLPPPAPVPGAPSAPAVPSSTAALASGPARSLDTGLRIGGDPRPIDTHTPPPPPSGQSAGWGAVLQTPEPASGSMARSAPSHTPPPSTNASSYEQAQDVLRLHGVTWQRLETWGDKGEWKFTCSVPNKQNPAIARNYEARANTPIEAIHAVLEKLEKEP